MKRSTILSALVVAAGAFLPGMRRDCGRAGPACAPRPAAAACHRGGAPACHKASAPAQRECPGMVCCIVRDARAAVAALSVAPQLLEEGVATSEAPAAAAPPVQRFASSPSPPGGTFSDQGFSSSASLRGPPALA